MAVYEFEIQYTAVGSTTVLVRGNNKEEARNRLEILGTKIHLDQEVFDALFVEVMSKGTLFPVKFLNEGDDSEII